MLPIRLVAVDVAIFISSIDTLSAPWDSISDRGAMESRTNICNRASSLSVELADCEAKDFMTWSTWGTCKRSASSSGVHLTYFVRTLSSRIYETLPRLQSISTPSSSEKRGIERSVGSGRSLSPRTSLSQEVDLLSHSSLPGVSWDRGGFCS